MVNVALFTFAFTFAFAQCEETCNGVRNVKVIDDFESMARNPTRIGKMGKVFSGQGILSRLEKSGKSYKILENSGNFKKMLYVIF